MRNLPVSCLMLLGLLLSTAASGQNYRNRHPFDFKKFNLGFQMGFTSNSYNLKEQVNVVEDGVRLRYIEVVPRPGLTLGMIANANLHKQVALRSVVGISLEERNFNFFFAGREADSPVDRKIEAAYLTLPLMLQWKTPYHRAVRYYVLTGGQWGINLVSNKRVLDDKNLLKINNQDLALVFGFGMNLYGERIKLSPEIKYTLGMVNIFRPEFTSHAAAIRRLTTQVITLSVNFE